MSARDELADVIESGYAVTDTDCPYDHAPEIADAILAAGYRKVEVVTVWGAAHAENGVVFNTHDSRRSAQAFVDSMAEVGHPMTIKTREHIPATWSEWQPAA